MRDFWEKIKNKIREKPFWAIGVFSLAAFLAGGLCRDVFLQNENREIFEKNKPQRQKETGYNFTSPLLDCDYYGGPFSIRSDEMKERIQHTIDMEISGKRLEHVSVYFRDLSNGPTLGIDEDEKFTPASLLKVPILITYLKKAEINPMILKEKRVYKKIQEENTTQNIKPQMTIEEGKEYEVDELLERMIVYSDNRAAQVLLKEIDNNFLEKVYTDLKIAVPTSENPENFMTVKEYASFFRILYNSSYLNREMSEKALGILSRSSYENGLRRGVPGETPIAHKFGERVYNNLHQLHDCGIIYHSTPPYILCVMSRGNDFGGLEKIIQSISSVVYREVDK